MKKRLKVQDCIKEVKDYRARGVLKNVAEYLIDSEIRYLVEYIKELEVNDGRVNQRAFYSFHVAG